MKGYTGLALRYLRGEVGADGTPKTAGKAVQTQVGDHWVSDELALGVGGRKYWRWNIMDEATRYILAVRISRTRNSNDAIALFEKAKLAAASPPQRITTDGLASYVDAVKAVFPGARHVVSQGIHQPVNNTISERLQGSFRQRTKTQRGLQARRTAQEYLDGWVIDYNFFKDHETLKGRTPAPVAGVVGQVPWRSWEDVTRLGGEVAEVEIKNTTPYPHKPGSKPKITGVPAAIREMLEAQKIKQTHIQRAAHQSPVVTDKPKQSRRSPSKKSRGGKRW